MGMDKLIKIIPGKINYICLIFGVTKNVQKLKFNLCIEMYQISFKHSSGHLTAKYLKGSCIHIDFRDIVNFMLR